MSAHLLPEARRDAEQAVKGAEDAGLFADAAEARLMLAEVALACGDARTARREAARAASALERQQRRGWFILARYVETCARWEEDGAASLEEAHGASLLARELQDVGWRLQATEIRIEAAKRALVRGDTARAQAVLSELEPLDRRRPAGERVRRWYAEALARLSREDRAGSLRALAAGLRVADQHQTSLSATELRARAATGAVDLAVLGLELALSRRNPLSVLLWAERCRARSFAETRVLPPRDKALARRLEELRQLIAEQEKATLGGTLFGDLEHRRQLIEDEVRLRSLPGPAQSVSSRGSQGVFGRSGLQGRVTARDLRAALGDRHLLEFVVSAGELYAVACTRSRCRLFSLGPSSRVEREQAALHLALGRLAYRRSAAASLGAAARLLRRAAMALDDLLLGQLRRLFPEARQESELVISPTGGLHGVPWALLPSLSGRPVLVVPSAGLWLARQHLQVAAHTGTARATGLALSTDVSRRAGRVLVVAGPDVPSGAEEVEAVRAIYPLATVLAGRAATVAGVLAGLEGATLAHLVVHGRFRSDNALFSALELHDGPLTVYDLEALRSPPMMVVLSACDAGRSQVHPGDELMGTSAALLSMGADTIIASVAPVQDSGVKPVMQSLHEGLAAGAGPAAALSRAQSLHSLRLPEEELVQGSERALAALAAGALICLGSGNLRLPDFLQSSWRHKTAMISP
jgi:hypothetical protein